jgi:hypothetical protein
LEEKPDWEKEEMMKANISMNEEKSSKIHLESQLKESKKKTEEGERIRDPEKVSKLIPNLILILLWFFDLDL